jgi:septal ring factor EnvC (AmiA/AmiB activator)
VFTAVLAGPRVTVHLVRRLFAAVLEAAEAVPRIATALDDVRATLRHLERLLTYVAGELPELADQLDRIRARIDGLEEQARHREPEAAEH